MVTEAMGFGLLISFLFYEFLGLVPGGLIVPGYLALYLSHPLRIVSTIGASLLTYLLVTQILGRVLILYGRRRYFIMIMTGFLLSYFGERLLFTTLAGDLKVIGYLITGIIADTYLKQGIVPTLLTLATAVITVRLLLILFS